MKALILICAAGFGLVAQALPSSVFVTREEPELPNNRHYHRAVERARERGEEAPTAPPGPAGRGCQVEGIVMHTKSNPHTNQPAHRLTLELKRPKLASWDCPATASMIVDSRAELMKLYELVNHAKRVTCHTTSALGGAHVNVTCDGSFEIRAE